MGADESGTIKRARQQALLRRQVAESTIASHGGNRRMMTVLSPRAAASFKILEEHVGAKTERQHRPNPEVVLHPSGPLSARGHEVVRSKPVRTEKVESALPPPKKRLHAESMLEERTLQPPRQSMKPAKTIPIQVSTGHDTGPIQISTNRTSRCRSGASEVDFKDPLHIWCFQASKAQQRFDPYARP
eukprot:g24094.t1